MEATASAEFARPKLTPEQREWRRLRAWELLAAGWKQKDIAQALGVSTGAVCQWVKRAKQGGGADALKRRKAPGGKQRVARAELVRRLPELVEEGAEAFDFIGAHWTIERVRVVIQETWGVWYHPSHVHRLLHLAGLSVQKPEVRAAQRDEVQIEQFKRREWKRLKRGHGGPDVPSSL